MAAPFVVLVLEMCIIMPESWEHLLDSFPLVCP